MATYYFNPTGHTVNTRATQTFSSTLAGVAGNLEADIPLTAENQVGTFWYDVYKLASNGALTTVQTGIGTTWSCPGVALGSTDALLIRLYANVYDANGGNSNTVSADFTTNVNPGNLQAGTWTLSLSSYTDYDEDNWLEMAGINYGTAGGPSKISGITFVHATSIPVFQASSAYYYGDNDYSAWATADFYVNGSYGGTYIGSCNVDGSFTVPSAGIGVNNGSVVSVNVYGVGDWGDGFNVWAVSGVISGSNQVLSQVTWPVTWAYDFRGDILNVSVDNILYTAAGGTTTKTKTFSTDALLKKTGITKTFKTDALLSKAGIKKTFGTDALLYKTKTKTFTTDAVLSKAGLSKTFTVDAAFYKTRTSAFTTDALLLKTKTKTFGVDALLFKTGTKTFMADAALWQRSTKTFGADAQIVWRKTKTVSVDANLAAQNLPSHFSVDALIANRGSSPVSVDALLVQSHISQVTLDAMLVKHGSNWLGVNF